MGDIKPTGRAVNGATESVCVLNDSICWEKKNSLSHFSLLNNEFVEKYYSVHRLHVNRCHNDEIVKTVVEWTHDGAIEQRAMKGHRRKGAIASCSQRNVLNTASGLETTASSTA